MLAWLRLLRRREDRQLLGAVARIVGVRPRNLSLYQMAVRHTSVLAQTAEGKQKDGQRHAAHRSHSNERLEYLGDALLGAIVAEYLFKKYPYKDEGFLTEIRSRMVNRESLNGLAQQIGLSDLIRYDDRRKSQYSHKSIHGDALEALVGAVYLDRGYAVARRFVIEQLVEEMDVAQLVRTTRNFKSKLIEWAQREGRTARFKIVEESGSQHHREFVAEVWLGETSVSTGRGLSKKKAEQAAARRACEALGVGL
ncbi:MAG: ribonuclease III [Catalinimonas sp.]